MHLNVFLTNELILLVVPICLVFLSLLPITHSQKLAVMLWGQLSNFILSLLGFLMYFCLPASQNLHQMQNFFKIDFAVVCLLMTITFIASVVIFYSERYLNGDSFRLNFMRYLIVLGFFASLITVSNNLIISFVAWSSISVSLWVILKSKQESKKAAKTVLYHHLFSDTLLLLALTGIVGLTKTLNVSELPMQLAKINEYTVFLGPGLAVKPSFIISLLIVLSMSIKSALFPFHRWLLATLEAPTPLSGFLHAGIVNVSAILTLQLFPILATEPSVMILWGFMAFISTVMGTLVMSTQNDVKRKLVYSTVGQMGFMNLQCAIGFLPAAIFHLMAHGLFKCHMFLQSGSAVNEGIMQKSWLADDNSANHLLKTAISLFAFMLLIVILVQSKWPIVSINNQISFSMLLALGVILFTAPALKKTNVAMLFGFNLVLFAAASVSVLLANKFDTMASIPFKSSEIVISIILGIFIVIDLSLPAIVRSNLGRALYVHSLNGFYIDDLVKAFNYKFKTFCVAIEDNLGRAFND